MAGLLRVAVGGVDAALLEVAVGNIVCALISQPMRAGLDSDREPSRRLTFTSLVGPIRLVTSHAELRGLAALSFVFSTVQMCLATYLVTYLHSTLAYTLVAAGAVLRRHRWAVSWAASRGDTSRTAGSTSVACSQCLRS